MSDRTVWLVARREFVERIRDRSFAISTAMTVFIVLAIVLIPRFLGGGEPTTYTVGTVGEPTGLAQALRSQAAVIDAEIELERFADETAARQALEADDADVVLLGQRALAHDQLPVPLDALLQSTWRQLEITRGLEDAGVDRAAAAALLDPPPLTVDILDPGDEDGQLMGVAFVGLMILYGQLFGYGMWVAMGVVEEKSTRVVEVLLSTIRPRALLAGKILGVGALGLIQLLLIVVVALTVVTVTGTIDLPPGTAAQLGQIVLWFVLGYVFYACAFAMMASLVSRQEELQNVMMPLQVLVMASFFAAIFALNSPESVVARVASFLPPSAPLTMPLRVAAGEAAAWEVVLAIGVTLAAAAALVPLAGKVYAGAVLRTGSRVKLSEALGGAGRAA